MSVTNSDPGFKPGVLARPRISPADRGPAVLKLTPTGEPLRPQPIPVTTFARLHNARAEGDFTTAKQCLRELRGYGYSVVVIGSAPRLKKGGGT